MPLASNTLLIDLRLWSDGDLPLLERMMGDPLMTEHLGGPETPQEIRSRHDRYLKSSPPGPDRMFVILAGPGHQPAGCIGYWERMWQGEPVWETGWMVLPEFQGRGVASAAAALVVERVRAEGRYRFLHAFPGVDNAPSNAICRKAGFTLLGPAELEYPPGQTMRCNDWQLDVFSAPA